MTLQDSCGWIEENELFGDFVLFPSGVFLWICARHSNMTLSFHWRTVTERGMQITKVSSLMLKPGQPGRKGGGERGGGGQLIYVRLYFHFATFKGIATVLESSLELLPPSFPCNLCILFVSVLFSFWWMEIGWSWAGGIRGVEHQSQKLWTLFRCRPCICHTLDLTVPSQWLPTITDEEPRTLQIRSFCHQNYSSCLIPEPDL